MNSANLISNDITRESLGQAMVNLLEKKPLAQITVKELCQAAGVSRNAYYRNYENREAVLKDYFIRQWQGFFPGGETEAMCRSVLDFLYAKKDLLIRLEKNGALYLMEDILYGALMGPEETLATRERYQKTCMTYAIYGLMVALVKDGFKTLADEAWTYVNALYQE